MADTTQSRARTEREAIAEALFADADQIIGRMEQLQASLPAMIADGVQTLNAAAAKATGSVVDAAKAEGALVRQVEEATRAAYASIATAAKIATEQETTKVQLMLAKAVETALEKVGNQAAAPAAWRVKVAALQAATALLVAIGGGVVGATVFGHAAPTSEEKAQLAAGRDFIRIYPQLDSATQQKITRLVSGQ